MKHVTALTEQLADKPGVVLGTIHEERASCQLLIDAMEAMKAQGVTRIYTEHFLANDRRDPLTDRALLFDIRNYWCSEHNIAEQDRHLVALLALEEKRRKEGTLDRDNLSINIEDAFESAYPDETERARKMEALMAPAREALAAETLYPNKRNNFNLLKTAERQGITVVPIDNSRWNKDPTKKRLEQFNQGAAAKVQTGEREHPNGKYVVVVGHAHAHRVFGVASIGERLGGLPVIDLYDGHEEDIIKRARYCPQYIPDIVQPDVIIQLKNRAADDKRKPAFKREFIEQPAKFPIVDDRDLSAKLSELTARGQLDFTNASEVYKSYTESANVKAMVMAAGSSYDLKTGNGIIIWDHPNHRGNQDHQIVCEMENGQIKSIKTNSPRSQASAVFPPLATEDGFRVMAIKQGEASYIAARGSKEPDIKVADKNSTQLSDATLKARMEADMAKDRAATMRSKLSSASPEPQPKSFTSALDPTTKAQSSDRGRR